MIETLGYIKTSNVIGGFKNLKRILGNDYFHKNKKMEIISEIAAENGIRGELYLDEFGIEISLGKEIFNDGSYDETFVTYVDDNESFYLKTWKFDENGWMLDEPIDEGYTYLNNLADYQIDEILNRLVDVFL